MLSAHPVGDFTEDLVMALEHVTKNTEKKLSEEESASVRSGRTGDSISSESSV